MSYSLESELKQPFEFTIDEQLVNRISDKRLHELVNDEYSIVHEAKVDKNCFGEFLFLTMSRPQSGQLYTVTFYGFGFHEYRGQWYVDEWAWLDGSYVAQFLESRVSKEEVNRILQLRQAAISILTYPPSKQKENDVKR